MGAGPSPLLFQSHCFLVKLQDKQQAASEACVSPPGLQELQLCLFDLSAEKHGGSSACSTCMADPRLSACTSQLNEHRAEGWELCVQDCQKWSFCMKTLVRLQH